MHGVVVSSVIVRAGLAFFENVTEVWNYTFQFFSVPIYALIVCGIGFLPRAWAKWRQLKECIWQRYLCLSRAWLGTSGCSKILSWAAMPARSFLQQQKL